MEVIRRLLPSDAEDFRPLRLESLHFHPEAFGSDAITESDDTVASCAQRLDTDCVFGGFVNGELNAIAGLSFPIGTRQRPMAVLWGVYVRRVYRGSRLAANLVNAALDHAQTKVDHVFLAVTAANHRAIHFYQRLGFDVYEAAPKSLKVGSSYVDQLLMMCSLERIPASTPLDSACREGGEVPLCVRD